MVAFFYLTLIDWIIQMSHSKKFKALGLMSGTSLDGVDLALCEFYKEKNVWKFNVIEAETVTYSPEWLVKLLNSRDCTSAEITKLDYDYGVLLGKICLEFLDKHRQDCDFIASHGHTVFHHPAQNYTLQIGKGSAISAIANKMVVCDFRSKDIALGGQGAPLVPVGDALLFSEFDTCLNLGGFANVSIKENNSIKAWDISPCNVLLNTLALRLGEPYDKNGHWAQKGKLISFLLMKMNDLEYYKQNTPKSLGMEWVEQNIFSIPEWNDSDVYNLLHTVTEHVAEQIALELIRNNSYKILVTGGGTHNHYLIHKIRKLSNKELFIPNNQLIDFKEAIIFAFLGVLRLENEINTLQEVTGASRSSIGACIYAA